MMTTKHRQSKTGTVISRAGTKTVVVRVDAYIAHPLYKKRVRKTKRFMVHDEQDATPIGALVTIGETKPLSKTKRWEIIQTVQQDKA